MDCLGFEYVSVPALQPWCLRVRVGERERAHAHVHVRVRARACVCVPALRAAQACKNWSISQGQLKTGQSVSDNPALGCGNPKSATHRDGKTGHPLQPTTADNTEKSRIKRKIKIKQNPTYTI